MHRKMTRFAFWAKCSGFTAPRYGCLPAFAARGRGGGEHLRLQQAGERDGAQAQRRPTQKCPAGELLVLKTEIHHCLPQ